MKKRVLKRNGQVYFLVERDKRLCYTVQALFAGAGAAVMFFGYYIILTSIQFQNFPGGN